MKFGVCLALLVVSVPPVNGQTATTRQIGLVGYLQAYYAGTKNNILKPTAAISNLWSWYTLR